jgi:hypothetical protein
MSTGSEGELLQKILGMVAEVQSKLTEAGLG